MPRGWNSDSLTKRTACKTRLKSMENLLKRNGLYQASVDSKSPATTQHQQVKLTFMVDTGKRARWNSRKSRDSPGIPEDKVARGHQIQGLVSLETRDAENVQAGMRNVENKYAEAGPSDCVRFAHGQGIRRCQQSREAEDRSQRRPEGEDHHGRRQGFQGQAQEIRSRLRSGHGESRSAGAWARAILRDYFQSVGYFEAQVDFRTRNAGSRPGTDRLSRSIPGTRHKLVDVEIKGNRISQTPVLRERMFLQPAGFLYLRHGRYSEGFSKSDQNAVTALYKANGFRDVHVDIAPSTITKARRAMWRAVVTVDEGPQYFVSDLKITGVQQVDITEITDSLASAQGAALQRSQRGIGPGLPDYVLSVAWLPRRGIRLENVERSGPAPDNVEYIITEGERRFVRDLLALRYAHHPPAPGATR